MSATIVLFMLLCKTPSERGAFGSVEGNYVKPAAR